MKINIGIENTSAEKLLPPDYQDNSGIGVHYIDDYLKQLNLTTQDNNEIKAKRKGLKISLKINNDIGNGLIRLEQYGPDPKIMLYEALNEAANEIGFKFAKEDTIIAFEKI
jgi:hypothetical protein